MTSRLQHQLGEAGIDFEVTTAGAPIPIEHWALCDDIRVQSGRPARIGVLLRLLQDEQASPISSTALRVAHAEIARLDASTLALLGLPDAAPVSLLLRGSGALADPEFRLHLSLLHGDGRPIVAPRRRGCLVGIGDRERVLLDPLYSVADAADRFNAGEPRDLETRMVAWSEVATLLPPGVLQDRHLEQIRLCSASAFTLDPFLNDRGEPDFKLRLGRWLEPTEAAAAGDRAFEEVLPPARQGDFDARFRALGEVKRRYALGGATYVVCSPTLHRTLAAVKRAQSGDATSRRLFLQRPTSFLRESLGGDEAEGLLEEVFAEEGLSERVREVGVWEPRVLPWLVAASEPWLPPEETGLRIGDDLVSIPPDEVADLLRCVDSAIEQGASTVDHHGTPIPATEQTREALRSLLRSQNREASEGAGRDQAARVALLIKDNLDTLSFESKSRPTRTSPRALPECLDTSLLPHQETALSWLQEHWQSGSVGALLADDMGLGKTLVALAFLAWLREEMEAGTAPRRPLLVVAPVGLLRTWEAEAEKHLLQPGVGRVERAYGPGLVRLRAAPSRRGGELSFGLPSLDLAELQRADWVLTTYETLRDYQHSFGRVHWGALVLDEAQKIKNPAAAMTDAAKAMKSEFVLALTGTPVENRVEDVWSIVDAARAGSLGPLNEFSRRYRGGDLEQQLHALRQLHDQLSAGSKPSAMLRRLKEDHLPGLPEKRISSRTIEMPPAQAAAYEATVRQARAGRPALEVLQLLRSTSLHPSRRGDESDADYISASARLIGLFEILDEVQRRREKALVFVEFHWMQDVLVEILQRRYTLASPVLVINGAVSGDQRKRRMDEFQDRSGFDVMVLSQRAGGVGLTLTAANHVVHLNRWWNPAVEDQCTDRVYRIGQTKDVHVHNIIARHPRFGDHSFDVRLDQLLERKRHVNRSVLAPAGVSDRELQGLYRETVEGEEGGAV